ncbi:MAG: hypothetical protein V7750_00725 [Sneathiella sp.]
MKRVGFVVGLTLLGLSTAHADFQAGLNAYNNKDFPKAVSLWQTEATAGDHNAQYNLGLLYEKGVEGYPKNLAKAYGWYRLAASQSVPEAQKAVDRVKALMTSGQIETGNSHALEVFGKWHRKNIGRNEAEHQAAKANLEKQRKAEIEAERLAAAARAERQRSLINQRDGDAKLAIALERDSKQAALKAAQEKAEEAKRLAFIEKRRKEEEVRLASLRADQEKQKKINVARYRLEELKAKQNSGNAAVSPVVKASPAAPVVAAPLKKPVVAQSAPKSVVQSKKAVGVSSPSPAVPVEKPKTVIAAEAAIEPAPAKVNATSNNDLNSVTAAATEKTTSQPLPKPVETVTKKTEVKALEKPAVAVAPPVQKIQKPAELVVAPAVKETPPAATTPKTVAAKPLTVPTSEKKPYKAKVEPSKTTVLAAKPVDAGKMKLPVMTNGLDVAVVKEIVEKANSIPLDSGVAKQEISKGRTNIEALKWSLISAARGKGSAKRMNSLLEKSMTNVQIAEANRLAANWINQRQKRQ